MRDYSNLSRKTVELLEQADKFFDKGNYDEAAIAYIDAEGNNKEEDLYICIDAMLGQLKCDVYKRVQTQSFSSKQGMNDVHYIRSLFASEEDRLQAYKKNYEKHFGSDQAFFNAKDALRELNNIREYYERSYKVYLETHSLHSFWRHLFFGKR